MNGKVKCTNYGTIIGLKKNYPHSTSFPSLILIPKNPNSIEIVLKLRFSKCLLLKYFNLMVKE